MEMEGEKTTIIALSMMSILIMTPLLQGCATGQAYKEEPITIGAILILTGTGSNWGENSRRGGDLAIKELNAKGGVIGRPVRMDYEDNPSDDPASAVTALNNLAAKDVKVVIGTTWSTSGLAVAPVACDEKILMVSPTLGMADFNERCDYLQNIWPHDVTLSVELGRHIYETGHRSLAILGSQTVWEDAQARAVRKGYEDAGGKTVAFELPPGDSQDFKTELLRIKEADPDSVYIQVTFQQIAARQLRQIGIEAPVYGVLTDEDRIIGAQGTLEGATILSSLTPTAAFTQKYKEEYGKEPDIGSDTAYDAVMLVAKAITETKSTDPTALKDYIRSLDRYTGGSGELTFDGAGGVTKPFKTMQVRGNKTVEVTRQKEPDPGAR